MNTLGGQIYEQRYKMTLKQFLLKENDVTEVQMHDICIYVCFCSHNQSIRKYEQLNPQSYPSIKKQGLILSSGSASVVQYRALQCITYQHDTNFLNPYTPSLFIIPNNRLSDQQNFMWTGVSSPIKLRTISCSVPTTIMSNRSVPP